MKMKGEMMTRNKNRIATKLFYRSGDEKLVHACYEAYILGQYPKKGSIIKYGNHLYITSEEIYIPGVTMNGKDQTYQTTVDEKPSKLSIRMFWSGRHLAVGVAASLTNKGVSLFPEEECPPLDDFIEWIWEDGLPEKVLTIDEVVKRYGVTKQQIAEDYDKHVFGAYARDSYRTRLFTVAAVDRQYGEGKIKEYPINPLLITFISNEAGELWNINHGIIRLAAAGGGHRVARMEDGEKRDIGRRWIVTRNAMERIFGPPVPEKMERFNKPILKYMNKDL